MWQDILSDSTVAASLLAAAGAFVGFFGWFFRWLPDYIKKRVEAAEEERDEQRRIEREEADMRHRIELEKITAQALSERVQADAMTMASSTIASMTRVIMDLITKTSISDEAYDDLKMLIEEQKTTNQKLDRLIYLYSPKNETTKPSQN